jgi:hypothetical protein
LACSIGRQPMKINDFNVSQRVVAEELSMTRLAERTLALKVQAQGILKA